MRGPREKKSAGFSSNRRFRPERTRPRGRWRRRAAGRPATASEREPRGAAGSATTSGLSPLTLPRNSSVLFGPSTNGTSVRSHCFVASSAIRDEPRRAASRAPRRARAASARHARRTKPAAPHSVPFSTAHSTRAGSAHASSDGRRGSRARPGARDEEEDGRGEDFFEGKRAMAVPPRASTRPRPRALAVERDDLVAVPEAPRADVVPLFPSKQNLRSLRTSRGAPRGPARARAAAARRRSHSFEETHARPEPLVLPKRTDAAGSRSFRSRSSHSPLLSTSCPEQRSRPPGARRARSAGRSGADLLVDHVRDDDVEPGARHGAPRAAPRTSETRGMPFARACSRVAKAASRSRSNATTRARAFERGDERERPGAAARRRGRARRARSSARRSRTARRVDSCEPVPKARTAGRKSRRTPGGGGRRERRRRAGRGDSARRERLASRRPTRPPSRWILLRRWRRPEAPSASRRGQRLGDVVGVHPDEEPAVRAPPQTKTPAPLNLLRNLRRLFEPGGERRRNLDADGAEPASASAKEVLAASRRSPSRPSSARPPPPSNASASFSTASLLRGVIFFGTRIVTRTCWSPLPAAVEARNALPLEREDAARGRAGRHVERRVAVERRDRAACRRAPRGGTERPTRGSRRSRRAGSCSCGATERTT